MTQKTPPAAEKAVRHALPAGQPLRPALTLRERLDGIEQMRKRLNEYVEFMCQVEAMPSSSAEAKENAVAAFYERMVALERQLGRIHDELRLG
jgi:hypothetical protein